MAEERTSIVSSSEDSSLTRQRKKRKWDQPAESLVTASVDGGPIGPLGGVTVPGAGPLAAAHLTNPVAAMHLHANAVAQKLNMIQEELMIAREIVINDAESSARYKLTKRQTQEEIQRNTGAVVIIRGKYHPPNAPSDGEKPLYLHISAGSHLKDTVERILAVDRAASMVEEMLKQDHSLQAVGSVLPPSSNGTKGAHSLSTCVFLGFDPDPLFNISARVRGPSDQYINHIMNETGASVILRGRGSGNIENSNIEGGQEQLHLFLSSNDSKSLENAKCLAENLLDTISLECGFSRVSSSKVYSSIPTPHQVYSAVPPPQPLAARAQSLGSSIEASTSSASGQFPVGSVGYNQRLLSGGTSYSGYGGIYPQATPLQQVALALRQSASPIGSVAAVSPLAPSSEPKLNVGTNSEKERRPPQRRKFQELPITSKDSAKPIQGTTDSGGAIEKGAQTEAFGSEFKRPPDPSANLSNRNMSPKFVTPSNTMPPLPPRMIAPPPPPPKFTSSSPAMTEQEKKNNAFNKAKSDDVPDTLVKLMEYGDDDDEDDDVDENGDEGIGSNSGAGAAGKPFWAL